MSALPLLPAFSLVSTETVFVLVRAGAVDVQRSLKSFCESKMADPLNEYVLS